MNSQEIRQGIQTFWASIVNSTSLVVFSRERLHLASALPMNSDVVRDADGSAAVSRSQVASAI